jgi:hypothetical protein
LPWEDKEDDVIGLVGAAADGEVVDLLATLDAVCCRDFSTAVDTIRDALLVVDLNILLVYLADRYLRKIQLGQL